MGEYRLIAYQLAPSASCSVAGRADVAAWKGFLELEPGTCVLDSVGCGPLDAPEYLRGWAGAEAVGIDPLQPTTPPSKMLFVKGIGEYLPFRPSTFDSVILATALDHVLSQQRVLSEAKRCLGTSGRVLIWLSSTTPEAEKPLTLRQRPRRLAGKRSRPLLLFLGLVPPPPQPFWQQLNDRLEVPPGAIDPYHFQLFDETDLQRWCSRLGLGITRRGIYATQSVFVELCLQDDRSQVRV